MAGHCRTLFHGPDYLIQDSTPKCRLLPSPRSKVHQVKYVPLPAGGEQQSDLLAVSTEDGRVVFYATNELQEAENDSESSIPFATPVAQIGGKQAGLPGRIKDFDILSLEEQAKEIHKDFLVVTGNSDGVVRIWKVTGKDLVPAKQPKDTKDLTHQIGKLLTTYETGNRITCLASFIMLPAEDQSTLLDSEDEDEEEEQEEVESSSDESDE